MTTHRPQGKIRTMNDIVGPGGEAAKPVVVRIHEVDIPLPTIDREKLKAGCLQPVYQPGLAVLGDKSVLVKSPDGKQGQVLVGHRVGFNGGQALIIAETAAALDELRAQINVLHKGLRVSLEVNEQLAKQAQIGQDGLTNKRLREIETGVRELRLGFYPDDPPSEIKE